MNARLDPLSWPSEGRAASGDAVVEDASSGDSRFRTRPRDDVIAARRLRVGGHVQGVGFRPFVYRLAHELRVTGSVQNLNGDVEIIAQGRQGDLECFTQGVVERAPPIAKVKILESCELAPEPRRAHFEILDSASVGQACIYVPADNFTCDACLTELSRADDRRYRYPFINCTQCGPRYTLITALPYDRANTTMASFELCAQCRREYEDPADRRFHAEPVACAVCGPRVWLEEASGSNPATAPYGAPPVQEPRTLEGESAIRRALQLLAAGAIVAVKGVGGYHLLCDATNDAAIASLRKRKRRPHKPLAVMFPPSGSDGLGCVRGHVALSEDEAAVLLSSARPVLLARRLQSSTLPEVVAPALNEVGVLLPYSPLHHILLSDFGRPIVATSGNISGEPVLTELSAARVGLGRVADACLHHDRPISRPADDSVVRVFAGKPRVFRLGRGLAPREMTLPYTLAHPLLATGGHLKNTVALAWDDRIVLSPHIADMGSVRSETVFELVIEDLQRLYGVRASEVVCDAHPDYATTRWALRCGLPVSQVLHHHAHASALAGEHDLYSPMLVFTWDGVGLGADWTLWGGETFLGEPGNWRRVASLRPFRLAGGERASRSPWRSAAALCWELGKELPGYPVDPLARTAWESHLNCPQTSSIGRLFDGAAALVLGLCDASYEGQGPMMLEAAADANVGVTRRLDDSARVSGSAGLDPKALPVYCEPTGLMRIDWAPLVTALLDIAAERVRKSSVHSEVALRDAQSLRDPEVSGFAKSTRWAAAMVHDTLAATILSIALAQRESTGVNVVGLTGGVFQNARLTELAADLLTPRGFTVCLATQIPCGDGGLSYGQIIEAVGAKRRTQCSVEATAVPRTSVGHRVTHGS